MTETARLRIGRILKELVLSAVERHSGATERSGEHNPFRNRIIRGELWRIPKFERSFVTSMGSRGFEEIARVLAADAGNFAERQHSLSGNISDGQAAVIRMILRELRGNTRSPDWRTEIEEIAAASSSGDQLTVRIISDLYVRTPSGVESFYAMKSPKPNLDQTEKAKADCLHVKAIDPSLNAYYAMPYNPFGEERADY